MESEPDRARVEAYFRIDMAVSYSQGNFEEHGLAIRENRRQERNEVEDVPIDDHDRWLNPIGRFYRHNAMHAGTTAMVLDEFGRCAKCVSLGLWKPNA